jgi:hypothetical protein
LFCSYSPKTKRNIPQTIKRRNDNWIGHILRRDCLIGHVIEEKIQIKIEVMGRRGRRRMQLVDKLKEKKGYRKLKEEKLDHTVWRTRFGGRGYGLVIRRATA